MSDEPGFPPPRGLENYREASTPGAEVDPPVTSEHHHVVATLANDPEHPAVESVHPSRRPSEKPPAMRRVLVAFALLLLILLSTVVVARLTRTH